MQRWIYRKKTQSDRNIISSHLPNRNESPSNTLHTLEWTLKRMVVTKNHSNMEVDHLPTTTWKHTEQKPIVTSQVSWMLFLCADDVVLSDYKDFLDWISFHAMARLHMDFDVHGLPNARMDREWTHKLSCREKLVIPTWNAIHWLREMLLEISKANIKVLHWSLEHDRDDTQ